MVEISIALAVASKAVSAIQQGFKMHKDASELTSQFSQFFDAKDDIAKARAEAENTTLSSKVFAKQSVESYALEVALAEHKTKELEKQLRELFVYTGQSEVYSQMMRIRKQERNRRLINARRKAEQKRFVADLMLIGGGLVIITVLLGMLMYNLVK
jgi:hypothetical protein|tara:strand:+ start:470 stop:937 length:468 start_codon:yes stop_codon:yes gene_type:complete